MKIWSISKIKRISSDYVEINGKWRISEIKRLSKNHVEIKDIMENK